METKRILDKLNNEQQLAVKETEGYIRVVAGAGSGKTRVLTHRYVYIAKALGVPTEHILSVTFTNKAANVMKKRIRDFIPDEDGGYIGTFHSICRKILSFDIHRLNYPKNFKILDVEDQKELLREIYEKNGLKLKNNSFSNVLNRIDVYKYDLKYIPELISTDHVKTFSNLNVENKASTDFIINEYLKSQRKNFYLDFADLVNFTLYLFKTDKEFNEKWSNHFEYIQVDEFQDVSPEQYELVSLLSKNNGNLFIVGDPDQTIYSFRGADVNIFLDFDKTFKNVKTIILDTNYRSTPQILNASNSLIGKNSKRIKKQLKPVKNNGLSVEYHHAKTRKDECDYIAKQIAEIVKRGGSLSDCAVLYRNNNNSRAIEEALIRNKLSYVIFSGFAFYKRKEIKDVIAYLEMAETTDDVSFLRTVNVPTRGIGKTRLAYLREEAEAYGVSLYTALKNNRFNALFTGTGANEYIELIESIKDLKENYSINDLLDYILKETGYEKMLMEDGDQERLDNVAELKDSIREFETEAKEKVLLSDYLNNVALITSADRNDKTDCVKMMTVHTAKGLEFKNVFVCQLNEGIFPSSQTNTLEEMEEERRLMYVAMTRAEERLVLTDCEMNSSGQMQLAPSRFIFDIDESSFKKTGVISTDYIEWAKSYVNKLNPKTATPTLNAKYSVGDTVIHEILGRGTIERIVDGAYRVRFDENKVRTISFKVELKKVSEKEMDVPNNLNAYARYVYDREFNSTEKQRERADFILKSNVDIERKLEDLSYNPFSKRDIVKYIIENGMLLENVFYPDRMLDEQGNDFRDFIESDNNFYFCGIETLLEEIDVNTIKNTETKKLIEKCTRAVEMWSVLNDLYCALPANEDCDMDDFENFYDLALNHIIACGEYYFKRSKSSKNYYIEEQNKYLIETLCEALNPYQAMSFKEYCQNTMERRQGE